MKLNEIKSKLSFSEKYEALKEFDIFNSNGNYNVAISASCGSGSTYFTNKLIDSYVGSNSQVFVIDVGRSYKDSCDLLGGRYIEFTQEANICINPFSFIKYNENHLQNYEFDDQIVMLKSIFLVSAGFGDGHPEQQLADSYFKQAIISSLQKYQTKSTYTTVHDELMLMFEKSQDFFAKKIADSIKSYTKNGVFGKFFEGESNLDLNNEYTVLELEELQGKGQLIFVILLTLIFHILQTIKTLPHDIKKICLINEAWDLMRKNNAPNFITNVFHSARQYRGSFITVMQSIDDYAVNETALACYQNAAIKLMFRQSTPKTIKVEEHLANLIDSLTTVRGEYSELLIKMNQTISKVVCKASLHNTR